jgi:hypothetical protein
MKTQIIKTEDGGIQVYQFTSYMGNNGRKKWDRQAVYLTEKDIKKINKLSEQCTE